MRSRRGSLEEEGLEGNMKQLMVAAGLASIFVVSATLADPPVTVNQSGLKFSVKDLTVNKGQSVVFMNDDTTTHNITVTGDGKAFQSMAACSPRGRSLRCRSGRREPMW